MGSCLSGKKQDKVVEDCEAGKDDIEKKDGNETFGQDVENTKDSFDSTKLLSLHPNFTQDRIFTFSSPIDLLLPHDRIFTLNPPIEISLEPCNEGTTENEFCIVNERVQSSEVQIINDIGKETYPMPGCNTLKRNVTLEKEVNKAQAENKVEATCSICLKHMVHNNLIGNPNGCAHEFCYDCIRRWSKTNCTCPIDRIQFNSIRVIASVDGNFIRREKVNNPGISNSADIDLIDDLVEATCEVCGYEDREEVMLLCDSCNLGFHYDTCIHPPLRCVPRGQWFCSTCSEVLL